MSEAKTVNTILIVIIFIILSLFCLVGGYFLGNIYPLKTLNISLGQLEELKITKNSNTPPEISPSSQPSAQKPAELVETEVPATNSMTIQAYHTNFSLQYPNGWEVDVQNTEFSSEITISKGDFKIVIRQGDTGAGRCVYPDEPDYNDNLDFPHAKYVEYTQFEGVNETFRVSQFPAQGTYQLCSKPQGNPEYISWTSVGFVNYETPIHPTENQLKELDNIVSTFKTQ